MLKPKPNSVFILCAVAVAIAWCSQAVAQSDIRLAVAGPYTHQNLTLFFLEGPETTSGDYLALDEALESKQAKVLETQDVNRLVVVNKGNKPVFVHAGDIVKGGQQDRTVSSDTLVLPGQRRAVEVFCVEQGRWERRGRESVSEFSSSKRMLSSRGQKLAAKLSKHQSEVWDHVQADQDKLGQKLSKNVKAATSASSLQLTLEHQDVQAASDGFIAKLGQALDAHPQAVGYAFAVNGSISAAEVYGSHRLFRKLWSKLLASNAVEAVLESGEQGGPPPGAAQVLAFLEAAEREAVTVQSEDANLRAEKQEAAEVVLFATKDKQKGSASLHKSYLKKQAPAPASAKAPKRLMILR